MKIGVFGGTFNPPHIGHLIGAEAALEQLDLSKILFVPALIPPHKEDADMPKGEHRLQMVLRSIQGNPKLQGSDLELRRGGVSYTVDTLTELAGTFVDDSFYLILGMDMLADFHQWRSTEEILDIAELVVLTRPDYPQPKLPQKIRKRVYTCRMPEIGVSSSEIRRRLREGKSVRYMVPDAVLEYIRKYRLYGMQTSPRGSSKVSR